jgi:uncharacterized damage-inducible protein DinB
LLEALLDSRDRNNTILLNLLRAMPDGGLEARAMEGSPSVAELFTHIHYVRLVFVFEDAPEFGINLPEKEWVAEHDPGHIAQMLNDSAKAVRDAVKSRVEAGREMNLHYDHPILLLQHMLWHEGYHHGQMKPVATARFWCRGLLGHARYDSGKGTSKRRVATVSAILAVGS